jgi:hypothetical protein
MFTEGITKWQWQRWQQKQWQQQQNDVNIINYYFKENINHDNDGSNYKTILILLI